MQVAELLDHLSSLHLLLTCRTLHSSLRHSAAFWRSVCRHLREEEWGEEGEEEEGRGAEYWRGVYRHWRRVEGRLRRGGQFQAQRIHMDLNSFRSGRDVAKYQVGLILREIKIKRNKCRKNKEKKKNYFRGHCIFPKKPRHPWISRPSSQAC